MIHCRTVPPVLVLVVALAATVAGRTGLAAGPPIRFGTEADDAPFASVGPDGALRGFDIDLGDAICAHAHLRCVWVNMDFDGLIPALAAHRIDVADSEMSVTAARARRVLFTLPVTATAAVLVVPKGSAVTDQTSSLAGKTVGVQSGTTHEVYANTVLRAVATVQDYQTEEEAFQDLADGRIDATLCDRGVASDWLARPGHAGFMVAGKPIDDPAVFGTGTALALRPGDTALKATLDAAIRAMLADGTYAAINHRYFSFSIAPALPAPERRASAAAP